ncbi:SPOR domain-containing protein [Erythrobacter crassostreae]|uniref:SPOR domain-containing protein n=1 Tax=Erythrobacter crassostreae TaxID=2828328 RepID=A0A9X1JKK7_9SPHN|nr:tetratricopeptide repeat protein [Erythrobacter crassostrea]MBV7259165.1 SPOR domain-containing protein [Erythrobacter crassostrea]
MTTQSSKSSRMSTPKIGLVVTTALASVALSGCTTSAAPPAATSFSKAQVALEKGQVDKAIAFAEEAVYAEPRNSGFRAMLGAAYLESGRFQSAATSFEDALELGSEDPRTVLSYSLAKVAMGQNKAALAKLSQWENAINPADYGLAIALAGNPERGIHVLTNTLRDGQNSAKVRQNLAYTYALAGNWRAARVMAAEDVPADQLDGRLSDWAANARPEDYQVRVASLLNVTPSSDGGMPQRLALANFPSQQMMVAEAEAQAPVKTAELAPAIATVPNSAAKLSDTSNGLKRVEPNRPVRVAAKSSAPLPVAAAAPAPKAKPAPAAAAKPVRKPAPRFVSNAVVQDVPKSAVKAPVAAPTRVAQKSPQRRMAVASKPAGTHLVQLGSFSNRAVAEAKWGEIQRKHPELKGHDVVITEARVNGKTFFRVAAAGFSSKSARSMCGSVKSAGRGCFAYAASSPPKGAVDRGVRIAARTR